LPEGFVVDVVSLLVSKFFTVHGEIQATRGERTAFTPSITVIVNALDELRAFSKPFEVFLIHCSAPFI
jgi:hypothetical protein